MSPLQFGTLKYIRNHEIHTDHARMLSMATFGSLVHRGWIVRNGSRLLLTKEGEDAYENYAHALPNYKKHESALSNRVAIMLHLKLNGAAYGQTSSKDETDRRQLR